MEKISSSLVNKKWMVCTFMSFVGLFILILCLKREQRKPDFESLQGTLPTLLKNLNGSVSSVENSLKTNVVVPHFPQMVEGIDDDKETSSGEPISGRLDGTDGDGDDETSSREPPVSQVLDSVENDNETSSGGASIPQTREEFVFAVDDGDADDTSSRGAPIDIDNETSSDEAAPISQNETSNKAAPIFISDDETSSDEAAPISQNETRSEAEPIFISDDETSSDEAAPISQNETRSEAEPVFISEDETSSDEAAPISQNETRREEASFISQNETSSGAAPIFISRNDTDSRTVTGPVSTSQNEMNTSISQFETNISISQNETPIFQDDTRPAAPPIAQTVLKQKEEAPSGGAAPIPQNKTTGVVAPIDADEHKPSSRADDGGCNLFRGRWVYKPTEYPLYHAHQCPFLSDQVNCKRNGRPDYAYAGWKWEPRGCGNIPRLDGKELLKRWRGKRVVIVGDSLNRNQWESLACILYSALPRGRAYVNLRTHDYKLFRARDYGCTVEFFWSPFLVPMEEKVVKLNTLPRFANKWRGAHIMIFNSGHWWGHRGRFKKWDFFEYKGRLVENMEVATAYKVALKTWAHWIDRNVDPSKTTVFFRSFSPEHKRGNQWCYNQTQPNSEEIYGASFPRIFVEIVEKQLRHMKMPVKYLNITHLSTYRKDAHTSVYTSRRGKLLTKEQQMQPKVHADCSHWCLPGLPDTWNLLMYMSTVLPTSQQVF